MKVQVVTLGTALLLSLVAFTSPVLGVAVLFAEETLFQAAVTANGSTLQIENFESIPRGAPSGDGYFFGQAPFALGGLTVGSSSGALVQLRAVDGSPIGFTDGVQTLHVSFSSSASTIDFVFDNMVTAFAIDVIDFGDLAPTGNTLRVFVDGTEYTLLSNFFAPSGNVLFAGITDFDSGFQSVSFAINDVREAVMFDRLQFYMEPESNPPAVPEPATLALVGLGLAGLAASRRRSVARSAERRRE